VADPAPARATYRVSDDGTAITCLICGKTSHNPHDVANRYCGFCHWFHDDLHENDVA